MVAATGSDLAGIGSSLGAASPCRTVASFHPSQLGRWVRNPEWFTRSRGAPLCSRPQPVRMRRCALGQNPVNRHLIVSGTHSGGCGKRWPPCGSPCCGEARTPRRFPRLCHRRRDDSVLVRRPRGFAEFVWLARPLTRLARVRDPCGPYRGRPVVALQDRRLGCQAPIANRNLQRRRPRTRRLGSA